MVLLFGDADLKDSDCEAFWNYVPVTPGCEIIASTKRERLLNELYD